MAVLSGFAANEYTGLQLAKIHSTAVDYIKSGKPATMHKSLNAKVFPHFMERKAMSKNYRSHKPVGRIYDRVNVEKFSPAYDLPFDDRILKRFDLRTEELSKARHVKTKYDTAMRRLMGQHECPVSEFEIWSTFVLSKPRVGTDYKLAEQVGRDVSSLKDRFRIICGETVRGTEQKTSVFSYSDIDLSELDRFVAAMYVVTHEEVQDALRARGMPRIDEEGSKMIDNQDGDFPMPLISFPWLFPKELARIATGAVPLAWARKIKQPNRTDGNGLSPKSSTRIANPLETKPSEEQMVVSKNEGPSLATNYNNGVVDEDYVRMASGQIIHRGEDLQLFAEQDAAIEDSHMSISHSKSSPSVTGSTLTLDSSHSSGDKDQEKGVDDEEGGNDGDEIDFACSDDEDDEDVLEAMAKRLAGCEREDGV